ncbi:site-specific integrase [Dawidia soli]|uniref:Site-specific integrase n=1 Tax=Dawidia soli TaxID=2782352 RepID=A0AAP2DFU1_9BACT|nr:site-specific integrase [Dawidia soli]MBT1690497.1 site-specific integrase [Dawidia soli]
MKNRQTFSILVWAYRGKQKENQATLYARITVNGKRAEISLSRKVDPALWDEDNCRVKGASAHADETNEFLDLAKGELRQTFLMLKATGETVTAEAIKNKYLGVEEHRKFLLEVFKEHNEHSKALVGTDLAQGTYKRYLVTYGKLQRFIKTRYKKSDVAVKDLGYEFISDFEFFLKTSDKIAHNTCLQYVKILKKISHLCVLKKWVVSDPFQGFKCIGDEVEREILNQEQLQTLMQKTFPSKRLEEVRDVFLFSCFTGYAYADVRKLTPDDIGTGLDGERWIFTSRTKTKTKSNIMLLPVALQLIEKYRDHPVCVTRGTLFPVKSNQKYNDYLKEIAALCGFKLELTTHIARHTFATTVTLSNDVPIETVSSMLGHKSLRTTQIYAKVVQAKVSKDMKQLRGKLFDPASQEVVPATKPGTAA